MSQFNSKSNQPKQYTAEFKAKVVLEVVSGTKSFSVVCRDYEISVQSLSNWKSLFLEKAVTIFDKAGDKDKKNHNDDFVYLAVLMDVYTRAIRGWHLGRSLEGEGDLTLTALKRALVSHNAEIHHSDQGVQYAANNYGLLLKENKIAISMAEVGEPTQNGHAERLMRTIKEEEVALCEYEDFADAYRRLGEFLDEVYTHKRIHSSLGYLTPAEFESQWQAQKVTQADFDC